MANAFLTPQIIAVEALRLLTSNLVYRDLVHTDYSKEFQKSEIQLTLENVN